MQSEGTQGDTPTKQPRLQTADIFQSHRTGFWQKKIKKKLEVNVNQTKCNNP